MLRNVCEMSAGMSKKTSATGLTGVLCFGFHEYLQNEILDLRITVITYDDVEMILRNGWYQGVDEFWQEIEKLI